MKKLKASSLILVLLVMAGVSVFILGTQRVSLLQYRQSVISTDSIKSRISALSGIEDALLRFRFNRDAQTEKDMEVRMDLTDGIMADYGNDDEHKGNYQDWYQVFSTDPQTQDYPNSGYKYDPSHQYYFMRMTYKVKNVGNYDAIQNSNAILKKDEAVEFSGFEYNRSGTGDSALQYRFYFSNDKCSDPQKALVQIQEVLKVENYEQMDSFNQKTVRMSDFGKTVYDSSGQVIGKYVDGTLNITATNPLTASIRMRAYGCDVSYALSSGPSSFLFDGLVTTVISKGIYGKATTTLVAEIDRKSGALIGIFDYNLYAQGDIKPPR